MESKPVQQENESNYRFQRRLFEYERMVRAIHQKQARSIDSAFAKAPIVREQYESANQKYERRSIHDVAAGNPTLCRLLRRGLS